MTQANHDLLTRAGAQLLDAAGMLRMEAAEWRDRKSQVPKGWDNGAATAGLAKKAWADRCERIAETNNSAATAFAATAKKIAAATVNVDA